MNQDDPLGLDEEEERIGEVLVNTRLKPKIESCRSHLEEIAVSIIEEGTDDTSELEEVLGEEYKGFYRSTRRAIDEPREIRDVHLFFKNILKVAGNDLGYNEDLYTSEYMYKENIRTWYYWFRLRSKMVDIWTESDYASSVFEMPLFRNVEEHEITGEYDRPDYAALAILSWYAFHDVLKIWKKVRDEPLPDDDWQYGFIADLDDEREQGFIAAYDRGPREDGTYFDYVTPDFMAQLGASVKFKESWNEDHNNYEAWKIREM